MNCSMLEKENRRITELEIFELENGEEYYYNPI